MPIPFRPIARLLTRSHHPASGLDLSAVQEFLPMVGQEGYRDGVLVTVNHYHAADFQAWWFVILVSAVFPKHIHWVVTSGWTNSGWLTPFTHWSFPLGARLLGFTPMPAMPPDPAETEARAIAIRQVLKYANQAKHPVVGMAPEGRDIPGGVLGELPLGTGRFLYLISRECPTILPVGVWKETGTMQLKFGTPYQLDVPDGLSKHGCDAWVGNTIMRAIAQCLPERLRGEYR